MLSIIVCIKQVPDTQNALFDPKTGAIDRSGTENILNPDDLHALEMALSIRDACGARITALTMGPPQAADALREAFSMGADQGVLVTDQGFAGSDSLVTSKILSRAIARLGRYDLVITGMEALDGGTAHVGFQLSEFLDLPLITQIHRFQVREEHAIIERLYGHEFQKIKVRLPLLIAVNRNMNRVRTPRLADINACMDREITTLSMAQIGGTPDEYGDAGSPTKVIRTELFSHSRGREQLEGTTDEKVDLLIHKLKKHNILRY